MPVPEDSTNPCLLCGACCAAYRVSFYWAEAPNLPDHLVETINAHYGCLAGTHSAHPRCQALEGEVGSAVRCSVYAARPPACHEVLAGDEKCNSARQRHGLPPISFPLGNRNRRPARAG
jgi:hypothetical protein